MHTESACVIIAATDEVPRNSSAVSCEGHHLFRSGHSGRRPDLIVFDTRSHDGFESHCSHQLSQCGDLLFTRPGLERDPLGQGSGPAPKPQSQNQSGLTPKALLGGLVGLEFLQQLALFGGKFFGNLDGDRHQVVTAAATI